MNRRCQQLRNALEDKQRVIKNLVDAELQKLSPHVQGMLLSEFLAKGADPEAIDRDEAKQREDNANVLREQLKTPRLTTARKRRGADAILMQETPAILRAAHLQTTVPGAFLAVCRHERVNSRSLTRSFNVSGNADVPQSVRRSTRKRHAPEPLGFATPAQPAKRVLRGTRVSELLERYVARMTCRRRNVQLLIGEEKGG